MPNQIKLFIVMIVLSVSACDSKPIESKIENPLAGHAQALEKAKEVEQTLLDAQQKTRDAIEKATK